MNRDEDITTTLLGCGIVLLILLAVSIGVDALLAALVHWAFPAIPFFQAFVGLVVLSVLLSSLGSAFRSK